MREIPLGPFITLWGDPWIQSYGVVHGSSLAGLFLRKPIAKLNSDNNAVTKNGLHCTTLSGAVTHGRQWARSKLEVYKRSQDEI